MTTLADALETAIIEARNSPHGQEVIISQFAFENLHYLRTAFVHDGTTYTVGGSDSGDR